MASDFRLLLLLHLPSTSATTSSKARLQSDNRGRRENMDLHLARHVVSVKKVTRQQSAHLLLFFHFFLSFAQL